MFHPCGGLGASARPRAAIPAGDPLRARAISRARLVQVQELRDVVFQDVGFENHSV